MAHILIADDDNILRKRIVKSLINKNSELSLHEAENGMTAINIIEAQPMDLVITDIQMPKVSGLMLISFLNAFAPNAPCFVITSYGTARLKSKMPDDLFRFYDKPIDTDELAIAVDAALSRQRDPNSCGGIQLPDFVNLASKDRATATITVTQQGHPSCKLFLVDGELINAITGDVSGEPAAVMSLSWPSPKYTIELGIPDSIERTITTPLAQVLYIVSECFDNP
ncbi:MAG: response regulator [Desulfobacterales bacterium]|jgi:CheY-like chemotaxis protein|nr:response regulator [Desulfobacteraceae bacterium]MBT7696201.1 response regulator [Desulfobacterales bacterium]